MLTPSPVQTTCVHWAILLFHFSYFAFQPLQLSGHCKIISAACFGQKDRPLHLCTASEDFIYIWNIDKILAVDNISKIF